ncbi:MAG: hypothetical protein K9N22_09020 [Candidatus Marinimicrobia bacterium]|nr:hypothetical protein [Candidatus Neomarinimicrobiota bacterium]
MSPPLKILYLRMEDTAGTLGIFKRQHEALGNECRYVTLFRSPEGFPHDIELNLPLLPATDWFKSVKHQLVEDEQLYTDATGYPPTWQAKSWWQSAFFHMRDKLWKPRIQKAIEQYGLDEFDIYHLEGGHGFLRMSAWPFDELTKQGKHILINYHGADMRTRGVLPWIDALAEVYTTSELDLMDRHPDMDYVFLPFEVEKFTPSYENHTPLRVCHATRDRYWKGSDTIISACEKLAKTHGIEFILIENQPHAKTLAMKAECDIYIDQVSNLGGWGYGMNSVEALSMGLACCTNLVPEYEAFIPDHPFFNVNKESLYDDLVRLIEQPERITELRYKGRKWVEHTHSARAVIKSVYALYLRENWIGAMPRGL